MWKKTLIIMLILYFFSLLQNSFFPHFEAFGAIPNLVFTLFFLLVFFEEQDHGYQIIIFSIAAGFFLDIFSHAYIGPSMLILAITGFSIKKVQAVLRDRKDEHPFVYFSLLFVVFLLMYDLLLGLYLHFFDPGRSALMFGWGSLAMVVYNLFIASALFFVYRKFLRNLEL